eukprot:5455844-Pyramimonas_sp.AAC.1
MHHGLVQVVLRAREPREWRCARWGLACPPDSAALAPRGALRLSPMGGLVALRASAVLGGCHAHAWARRALR